ncbi:MAG: tetratricopeptide repeat protein [Bryobacteraceae bacterium]
MTAEECFQLGLRLAREDKLGDAFVALEECVALDPDHGLACKELARLSLLANEVRAFINWLHEAQRVNERDSEPHVMMTEHLVARRRWEEADMEIRIALRKDPGPELVERLAAAQARIPDHF